MDKTVIWTENKTVDKEEAINKWEHNLNKSFDSYTKQLEEYFEGTSKNKLEFFKILMIFFLQLIAKGLQM